MTYKTKIHICEDKYFEALIELNSKVVKAKFSDTICSVDWCGCSDLFYEGLSKLEKLPRHYIYDRDKNTKILEDYYGDPMNTYKAGEFLEMLKMVEAKDKYRRYRIAIAALENVLADFDNPIVITEGH